MALREEVKATLSGQPATVAPSAVKSKKPRLWKVDAGNAGLVTPSPFFAHEYPDDPRDKALKVESPPKAHVARLVEAGETEEEATAKLREAAELRARTQREADTDNYLRGQPIEAKSEQEALARFCELHRCTLGPAVKVEVVQLRTDAEVAEARSGSKKRRKKVAEEEEEMVK